MAVILNIETSTKACSVALTAEGMVLCHYEEFAGQNHAALLSDFIKKCLDHLREHEMNLEAVAVSIGPGSYTGLRIGLSEAKGLAFALDIPLIGVSSLEIMAVNVMFNFEIDPDSLLVPMIDARRMEVYTAVYDFSLNKILKPSPFVLDGEMPLGGLEERVLRSKEDESQKEEAAEVIGAAPAIYIFGDGSDKAIRVMKDCRVKQIPDIRALAVDMLALSERAYRDRDFLDLAYSTPEYLKEFQASKPKPLL